jgi:hypothetical protein
VDAALREGLRDLPGGSSLARLLAEKRHHRNIHGLQPLSLPQILAWADAHKQRTHAWPTAKSGGIADAAPGETWRAVDTALRNGQRTLPGGSSLAKLLAEQRAVRNRKQLPPYQQELLLAWADAHRERTGSWPTRYSGPISDAPGETWLAVDMALRHGRRNLPGGSSLPLLLAENREVRNRWTRSDFSVEQIIRWTDTYHDRTGQWPHLDSGPIAEAPGETWNGVDKALRRGLRGLSPGSSLAKLLAKERGVHNSLDPPPLSRKLILRWADRYFRRTGRWPTQRSGSIPESPGDTWAKIDAALKQGSRSLCAGSSLARLLALCRGQRHWTEGPRLSFRKILAWADAHFQRTGSWPNVKSGPVMDAPGENWHAIDEALTQGNRGLKGGSSLLRLLVRKREVRDPLHLPPLAREQIIHWARLHFERTGRWPNYKSGSVTEAPGETWAAIDSALRYGKRTLSPGLSLAKLIAEARAIPGASQREEVSSVGPGPPGGSYLHTA